MRADRPWLRVLAIPAFFAWLVAALLRAQAWWRGELDWRGQRSYEPAHPSGLDRVDLHHVHAELLPRWLIEQAHRARGDETEAEAEAWQALHAAVAPDANLAGLLHELRELSPPSQLRRDPRRALYLAWAWNHYLDLHQAPFLVQVSVRAQGFGPSLAATIYRIRTDGGRILPRFRFNGLCYR